LSSATPIAWPARVILVALVTVIVRVQPLDYWDGED